MSDLSKFIKKTNDVQLATVVEVSDLGVKLHLDGESNARETYYNSLVIPNVNDRVFFVLTGNTILVLGTLKF